MVDVQRETGLDRVVEGQLRWDDMLAHPLAVHDAVETRGIVRYYDNNNFYREPVVQDELDVSGDVAGELESAADLTDDLQAVLPGPYSLAELATDEYYGDDADFAAIADFAGELEAFPAHETLYLLEPSLVEDAPGDGEDERASEAIDRVASATDADVVVHPYWARSPRRSTRTCSTPISTRSASTSWRTRRTTSTTSRSTARPTTSRWVSDGQNTLVEEPEAVRDRVDWVEDQLPVSEFETVYLTTNTETFYLPYNKYEAKLEALAEAAALANAEVTTT